MFSSIAGELIILFVPQLLSPLHLASYHSYQIGKEREKKLKRLSKKMILIKSRFGDVEEEQLNSLDNIDRVELFYQVYHHLNDLTIKELKILRDFCYALNDQYDLRISRSDKESEQDVYYRYRSQIDDFIDLKTYKK